MTEGRSLGRESRRSGHFYNCWLRGSSLGKALFATCVLISFHRQTGAPPPHLVELSTGTGPAPCSQIGEGRLSAQVNRTSHLPAQQPVSGGVCWAPRAGTGRASVGPLSVILTSWGVVMLCSGAGGSVSRRGKGGQGLPSSPSSGDPSLCGSVWGFYSCEANIPGAHRASKIISHRRSLSCLMRKR